MANIIREIPWITKPPVGTQLNPSHPLASQLVGAYLMNEGGGLITNLLDQRSANYQDSSVTWVTGRDGPGLNFPGTAVTSSPWGPIVVNGVDHSGAGGGMPAAISMMTWFYFNGTDTHGAFLKWGGCDDPSGSDNGSGLGIGIGLSDADTAGHNLIGLVENIAWIPTGKAITAGWHQAVITGSASGGVVTVYLDGIQVATDSNNYRATINELRIGGYFTSNGSAARFPVHKQNLALFWTRILTQNEVQQLYLNPYAMFTPQRRLIGVGGAGVIYDSTSNSGYQASVSTYNWTSHSVTTQTNRMMLLEIAVFASGSVSSATLGSQNFTFLRAKTNGVYRIETWYLIAPNTGTNTVTVNLSASVTSIATELVYYNTDQTAPIDVQGDNSGTGNPATVALTSSKTNSRMVGSLVTPTASGVTDAAGQNQRDIQSGALGTQVVSDSDNIASPASNTLTWNNIGTLDTWASTGVMLITPQANISSYISFLSLLGVG